MITADLEVDGERHLAHFVLRNVGAGIARAVRFKIDPPFENPKKPQLGLTSDKPFVQRGVPIMVAGKEIRTLVGVFGDWGGISQGADTRLMCLGPAETDQQSSASSMSSTSKY